MESLLLLLLLLLVRGVGWRFQGGWQTRHDKQEVYTLASFAKGGSFHEHNEYLITGRTQVVRR